MVRPLRSYVILCESDDPSIDVYVGGFYTEDKVLSRTSRLKVPWSIWKLESFSEDSFIAKERKHDT